MRQEDRGRDIFEIIFVVQSAFWKAKGGLNKSQKRDRHSTIVLIARAPFALTAITPSPVPPSPTVAKPHTEPTVPAVDTSKDDADEEDTETYKREHIAYMFEIDTIWPLFVRRNESERNDSYFLVPTYNVVTSTGLQSEQYLGLNKPFLGPRPAPV